MVHPNKSQALSSHKSKHASYVGPYEKACSGGAIEKRYARGGDVAQPQPTALPKMFEDQAAKTLVESKYPSKPHHGKIAGK